MIYSSDTDFQKTKFYKMKNFIYIYIYIKQILIINYSNIYIYLGVLTDSIFRMY